MQTAAALHRVPAVPRVVVRSSVSAPATSAARLSTQCCNCNLREACLPCGTREPDLARMAELVFTRRRIKTGEHLYRAGDDFNTLYAVRSGFFRTNMTLEDGREQITGFFMAGEMIGLDGIHGGAHTCDVVALEDSDVCVIPYARMQRVSQEMPAVQHQFHRMMGREITRDYGLMLLLGSMRAEERLATFLLNLSTRYAARGYSATEFNLRMSREDIASYLGLTIETVSRVLSRFQKNGLIEVGGRRIEVKDLEALRAVIGGAENLPRTRAPARATAMPMYA